MNITRRPAASLATGHFDTETLALLEAVDVLLPYAAQLRIAPSATATEPLPLAA
ncbi:hypothetical protein [Streptomyces syringium]|uniref:hypothetical protein n=1 Tax=Streptomyces syringium TaxID=76729 RepID=UPI0033B351AE